MAHKSCSPVPPAEISANVIVRYCITVSLASATLYPFSPLGKGLGDQPAPASLEILGNSTFAYR